MCVCVCHVSVCLCLCVCVHACMHVLVRVCVCVCVCVSTLRLIITSGWIWCDINAMWLFKQVLQLDKAAIFGIDGSVSLQLKHIIEAKLI